jgi:hypothetical protein
MITRARAALLLLGLALAGCTQVPKPFQPADKGDNDLLKLPSHTGVAVAPVTGDVPGDGTALARAMAEALQTRNLPATVGSGNAQTRWLLGTVQRNGAADGRRVGLRLTWELYGPGGERLGDVRQTRTVPERALRHPKGEAMTRLLGPAAREVAAMIQGPAPDTAALPGYPRGTRLVVGEIRGAPGAATRALAQALAQRLRRRDLPVSDRAKPGDVVIEGRLRLGESNGTNRPMELTWILQRAGETGRMGDLRQANRVPDSAVEKGWDRLAGLVTRAALPGVLQVIRAKAPGDQ